MWLGRHYFIGYQRAQSSEFTYFLTNIIPSCYFIPSTHCCGIVADLPKNAILREN
jgi:hypothetical protein